MKYLILVPDGAGDENERFLGGVRKDESGACGNRIRRNHGDRRDLHQYGDHQFVGREYRKDAGESAGTATKLRKHCE